MSKISDHQSSVFSARGHTPEITAKDYVWQNEGRSLSAADQKQRTLTRLSVEKRETTLLVRLLDRLSYSGLLK
jgi:hypothetical protein